MYPPKHVLSIANRYANRTELDPLQFNSIEANKYLENLGFEIFRSPKINEGQKWLAVTTYENWSKCLKEGIWASDNNHSQQIKKMRQGDEIIVYLVGMKLASMCKVVSDYYFDDSKIWPNGNYYPHRIRIEAAILPPNPSDMKKLYNIYLKYKGASGGYFGQAIRPLPLNEFSIFQSELTRIVDKLVKWDYKEDIKNGKISRTDNNAINIFVTGYDEPNLQTSKKLNILGWAKNSNYLKTGDMVFVFDLTNQHFDSCFEIVSKMGSDNGQLIWNDEIQSGNVIYPNRWKSELIRDSLQIPLADINTIPPFTKESFQGLLRGSFPLPLNNSKNKEKYDKFTRFITDKIFNFWIFIVSDQPKVRLSAEDIYRTRMNDKFWALNKQTPYKKHLRKGDYVLFCHGSKKFLGTARLGSKSFETNEKQRQSLSHGHDFYKANYGVTLSNIQIWNEPKQVIDYVSKLSFVSDPKQYPVYFQGGIKKIEPSEYYSITGFNYDGQESILDSSVSVTMDQETGSHGKDTELTEDQPLEIPSEEQLQNAYFHIKQKLLIDEETIRNIVSNLVSGKHVLLAGPIGTGKTHLATMIPMYVWKQVKDTEAKVNIDDSVYGYYPEVFTASSTWTPQDVIGSIYPKIDGKEITYEIQNGCVSDTVLRNWTQNSQSLKRTKYITSNGESYKGVWLVIDEFNRANIDGSFGEMITALEYGKLKMPTNKKGKNYEEISIPKDYRVIGTLNTFDKHFLFKLSDALKRRFAYIEILPPQIQKAEEEKYYVLKRSIESLTHFPGLLEKVVLKETDDGHEIDREKTDPDLLFLLDSSFDMFNYIRLSKNLGTAVLISMFKYILTDYMLFNDKESNANDKAKEQMQVDKQKRMSNSLDNAFRSNIIPLLEGKSKWSLECIRSFCCEQIVELLKKQNSEQIDFSRYEIEFKKLLTFLKRSNIEKKQEDFRKRQISEADWSNYDPWKGKKRPRLPNFRKALNEMIEESEII